LDLSVKHRVASGKESKISRKQVRKIITLVDFLGKLFRERIIFSGVIAHGGVKEAGNERWCFWREKSRYFSH